MELNPKVGLPIYFVATKPDAGTWRCGKVEQVVIKDEVIFIHTQRSVYRITEEKD